MSLKNAYREKLEAQLEEHRARLNLLKAKARRAVADGRIMAYEELADAESKFATAKARLKEFGSASGSAWETMRVGLDTAWKDLADACQQAADKFKTKGKP